MTEACFPLSSQQELWCTPAQAGGFHPRFIVSRALRITGQLDPVALQHALDDVVARHELLRTTVECDAGPPCQRVHPPLPVPLRICDLPTPHQHRRAAAEEQLAQAEASSVDIRQLPLLRATLARFDERDSVLSLVAHHTACDGWSMNLVLRDLAACYAARTGARPLSLPEVAHYRDYARRQHEAAGQPAALANRRYWQEQLDGARLFTLPTDRPVPSSYTAPYAQRSLLVDPEVAAALSRLVKAERLSGFAITLAAFAVLAHRIDGGWDPTVVTMFHGRVEPRFRNTVGWFVNFPSMRIRLAGCRSFRDLAVHTRAVSVQAYEHEMPNKQVMEAVPSLAEPLADPRNTHVVFGYWDAALAEATGEPFEIGESAVVVRKRGRVSEQLPGGAALNLGMTPAGQLVGGLHFSPEELDEQTADGWVSDYCQILARAMADPDGDWRAL